MSEIVTYAKAEFFESRIFPKVEFFRKPNFSECRICAKTECTEFRSSEEWIEHTT